MHASAGWYGDHTVDATSAGVTVRKGLDLDTLALPALKFEIRSNRDDPVGVRVVDRLPATVDPNRVGVHADFAADQWTAFEDGRVTFTTRLDPERPVVTLYGIWIDDPSRVHELLGRPDVKVSNDPDAPSLEPVGDEVKLPTVDDSLRSVGPDALVELREDVEEALTGARAEPADAPTALPAPGVGFGDEGESDGEEPAGTMGDHAWTYPVERMGTGRIAAPTHADLDELVEDETDSDDERGRGAGGVGEGHVYLRAALADTHHGGGGAVLLQELANAFQVVARRVTGDAERATVDAVVKTPLGTEAVLSALADRDQVTDALVSPLVGDREDATGIDAEPEADTETAEREDTEEFSIEPDSEDVEVVLNADGERFAELKAEFGQETDTEALEAELADLELPGVDTSGEPTIDELVDDDDFELGDDTGGFVPASVEGEDALSFDDETTELDFAADADGADDTGSDWADDDESDWADDDESDWADDESDWAGGGSSDDDAFEFLPSDDADATDEPAGADDQFEGVGDEAFETAVQRGFLVDDDPLAEDDESDALAEDDDVETVEVPVRELEAVRAEVRELRDRVATLEGDLAAVRADLVRERYGRSPTPTPEPVETSEDAE